MPGSGVWSINYASSCLQFYFVYVCIEPFTPHLSLFLQYVDDLHFKDAFPLSILNALEFNYGTGSPGPWYVGSGWSPRKEEGIFVENVPASG